MTDIDLYIPFVDGDDEQYVTAMKHAAILSSDFDEETSGRRRINNFGQLRLAIRSVYFCLPWIRRVHLVFHKASHIPSWLNVDHPKIFVHLHSDYFDPDISLPTFSSFIIDTQIGRVPGLADQFIYMEDDQFFCDKLQATHFFDYRDQPIHDYSVSADGMRGWDQWEKYNEEARIIWPNTYKFGNFIWKSHLSSANEIEYFHRDDHRPFPFLKSIFKQTNTLFEALYSKSITQKFRRSNVLSLYSYLWGMVWNAGVANERWKLVRSNIPDMLFPEEAYKNCMSACINDNTAFQSEEERIEVTRSGKEYIKTLTNKLFPSRSPFERTP